MLIGIGRAVIEGGVLRTASKVSCPSLNIGSDMQEFYKSVCENVLVENGLMLLTSKGRRLSDRLSKTAGVLKPHKGFYTVQQIGIRYAARVSKN